ncbi:MAG: hypothetical protein GY749_34105 [Desulfobacteraceae bacterium]|nr:hypothetical protein [Desulfobacteraceae bacterium]
MKIKKHTLYLTASLLIILFIFCNAVLVAADKPVRILILPFNIHSDKDLSFLRKGIEDMLSTRLTKEDRIVPISREDTHQAAKKISGDVTTEIAISLGQKFRADYVLYGSLTVFGDSISTDAKFLDLKKKKNVAAFHEVGKNNSDVIFHINRFASRINEKIFGRKTDEFSEPSPRVKDDSRKHPDSLWAEKKKTQPSKEPVKKDSSEAPAPSPVQPKTPAVTPPPSQAVTPSLDTVPAPSVTTGAVWKSQNFKLEIKGMAVGDVNGDNKNETVLINKRDVFIYSYSDGKYEKIGTVMGSNSYTLLNVDVADINKNGISEIFVTSVNRDSRMLRSFVLEWDRSDFVKTEDSSKWYFRIINVPARGKILFGQKRGVRDIFSKGIHELKGENNEYVSVKQEVLPLWINVYGFAYGDVLNNGQEMIVAFAQNEHIRLLNKDGSEEWRSSEPFGGSSVYLEYPAEGAASIGNVKEKDRLYLSQRIHIADTDKDGKNEIIIGRNKDTTGRIFSKFRMFKSGHIECLAWDNVGFYQKWKTREISGRISDYVICDFDNDGQDELVFSVVMKTSSFLSKAKSFIVSQEL